jgi:hypothetical protein
MSINDDLFAYRESLLDTIDSETIIIKELKYYLLDLNIDRNIINTLLYNFYQHFGIDMELDTITQITIPSDNMITFIDNIIRNNIIPIQPVYENLQENVDEDDEDDDIPPPQNNFQMIINELFNHPHVINNDNIHAQMIDMINVLVGGFNQNANMEYVDVKVSTDPKVIDMLNIKILEEKLDYDCAVCLSSMEKEEVVMELPCKHSYHKDCIEPYLKDYSYKCPVCRSEVGETVCDTS